MYQDTKTKKDRIGRRKIFKTLSVKIKNMMTISLEEEQKDLLRDFKDTELVLSQARYDLEQALHWESVASKNHAKTGESLAKFMSENKEHFNLPY